MPVFPALKKTLFQMIGPSIIFVALSLNGGEMLLWPNLAANYGLNILWPIPIILLLQFFVNIEIERYTIVTGKSVEESLVGKTKWLALFFAGAVLFALVWPAWMTTAGNLIATLLGYSGESARNIGLVSSILLLLASLLIFQKKESYKILETISKYGLLVALGIIFFVVAIKFDTATFVEGLKGLFAFGFIPTDMPRFDFVAALAYGGVAGVLNLVQSEWVKDKHYGINALSKNEQSKVNLKTKTSIKHYKQWFSFINKEHFLLFVLANVFSIFLLAYLGRLLLPLGSAQGFEVLSQEIQILNNTLPHLGTLFGISGILIFVMANITILDAIGRLTHRMLTPFFSSRAKTKFSSYLTAPFISKTAIFLGILILLSSLFFPSFKQPFFLLVLSASLSAGTMWLYPPMLLKLNLSLPQATRPNTLRILMVICTTAFYGLVTLWALSAYIPLNFVILLGATVTCYHLYLFTERKNRSQT